MSLLLLFADQESVQPSAAPSGGPALERAPRQVWLPRRVFAYEGRARIHVAAAGRSSFVAGTSRGKAPVAAAPVPEAYRFTGRASLQISEKGTTSHQDPWIEARREDEELLLLL